MLLLTPLCGAPFSLSIRTHTCNLQAAAGRALLVESLTTTVETPPPSTAMGNGDGDRTEGAEGAEGAVTPGGTVRHGHLSPDNARRRAMALDHLLNGLKASGKEEKEEGDGGKKGSGLLDVPVVRHAVELLAV
jgi:hypothetical protein